MNTAVIYFLFAIVLGCFSFCEAQNSDGCDCQETACGCCVSGVPLVNNICVNLTWDAQKLQVGFTLIVNSQVVASKIITDDKPVQVCVEFVCDSICGIVRQLNITTKGACGEVFVSFKCWIISDTIDIDSFYLPPHCNCVVPPPNEKPPVLRSLEAAAKRIAASYANGVNPLKIAP